MHFVSDRRRKDSPENYCYRIRTTWRASINLAFLARCCQCQSGRSDILGDGDGGGIQARRRLSWMIAMEHGLVRLQHGEYERSHAGDEKLRNNDKDVVYTLPAHAERS